MSLPTPAIGALIAIAALVGVAAATNLSLYLALLLIALVGFVFVLRHPTSIAYIALAWLMFEKSIGTHDENLTNLLSNIGDGLLVAGLVLAIIVNLLRQRRPALQFGQIAYGAAAFLAIGVASALANSVPVSIAIQGLLDSLRSILMFLIIVNIGISARDVEKFAYWVVGIMSVSSLVAVLQIVPSSPAWKLGGLKLPATHGLMRVDGLFDHPLSQGDYLALTLPLAILLLTVGDVQGRARKWLIAGVALMTSALVLTFAREAWLAVPVSIVVVGLVVERRLVRAVLPPLILLGIAAAPFVSSINQTDSGQQRLTFLQLTWPLISGHPLIGVGPGRFGGHVAAVTNTPLYAEYHLTNFFYGTGNQIDQFWTHLLAESGILGVGAFLAMIIACFLVGRRAYRDSGDPRRRAIILGLMCAAPSAVLLSFVSSVLEEGPASALFWAFMGMLAVLALRRELVPVEALCASAHFTLEDGYSQR